MKKITYLFTLIFLVALSACTSDNNKPVDKTPVEDPAEKAAAAAKAAEEKAVQDAAYAKLKAENRAKYDKVVTGLKSPESVITDGKFFYVSNVGEKLAPSEKDGDGFISKLDKEGNIIELEWLSGDDLHAPKGMAIVKGVLYVADIDKIRGFKISSKKKVFELDMLSTNTKFLNDLTVKDNNTLFVSATDVGFIYEVSLKGKGSFEMLDIYSDLTGVNGLYYDKKKNELLINSFGVDGSPYGMVGVCPLDAEPLKQKTIGTFKGFLDGIQPVADEMVLVTDWQNFERGGNLTFYDLVTEEVRPVLSGLIGGPADFYYDEKTKNIWLPAMQDSELIITKLDLNLVRPNQGHIIKSTGGYQATTKDELNFEPVQEEK